MKRFTELTIVTPNRAGTLGKILEAIARAGINITALDSSAGFDMNVVRFVTDDPQPTKTVLEKLGYAVTEETVLGVLLPDRPGQLARLAAMFGQARINIDYLHATSSDRAGEALVICHVSDLPAAEKALAAGGIA